MKDISEIIQELIVNRNIIKINQIRRKLIFIIKNFEEYLSQLDKDKITDYLLQNPYIKRIKNYQYDLSVETRQIAPGKILKLGKFKPKHPAKEKIERLLTRAFAKNDLVYQKTCHIFENILEQIKEYDIIPKYKGSMAMKILLKELLIESKKAELDAAFINSDNDTIIITNNNRREISNIIYDYLVQNCLLIYDYLKEDIKSVEKHLINGYYPEHIETSGFDYENSTLIFGPVRPIRIQRNFINIEGGAIFELIRIKASYKINKRIFQAEILDISIPYN